jgi:hypothetical protein
MGKTIFPKRDNYIRISGRLLGCFDLVELGKKKTVIIDGENVKVEFEKFKKRNHHDVIPIFGSSLRSLVY